MLDAVRWGRYIGDDIGLVWSEEDRQISSDSYNGNGTGAACLYFTYLDVVMYLVACAVYGQRSCP